MSKSLFKDDLNKESIVASFLDKYLYPKISVSSQRITLIADQMRGKDVEATFSDLGAIIIDEKAQLNYVNRPLPTFAMEVSYKKNTFRKEGWLFDKNKVTEYYMLIWVRTTEKFYTLQEDILDLECYLIKRQDIIDFLNTKDITSETIDSDISKILSQEGGKQTHKASHDAYFFFTKFLAEQPINIVIRKQILANLASKKYRVTKNEITLLA
jgi:hypothetical protein